MNTIKDKSVFKKSACTCFPGSTLAVKRPNSVVTRGTVEAGRNSAVIDVLRAVMSSPAIHTNAGKATDGIRAGCPVFANAWSHGTFVYILTAVSS